MVQTEKKKLVQILENMYAANEIPAANPDIAMHRIQNAEIWDKLWQGSPVINSNWDGKEVDIFDHRKVEPNNLKEFPLRNPQYISDNWEKLRDGALAIPPSYEEFLRETANNDGFNIFSIPRANFSEGREPFSLRTIHEKEEVFAFLVAFLGIHPGFVDKYIHVYRGIYYPHTKMGLSAKHREGSEAIGRLSSFSYTYLISGTRLDAESYSFLRIQA